MGLLNILSEDAIKVDLESEDKEEAFEELIDVLVRTGCVKNRRTALEALWKRESQASTGIGLGVGIPHCKTDAVDELVATLGISREGIEFDAIDHEPVYLVFLILAPENTSGPHVRALAQIAVWAEVPGLFSRLRKADSPSEVLEYLAQASEED